MDDRLSAYLASPLDRPYKTFFTRTPSESSMPRPSSPAFPLLPAVLLLALSCPVAADQLVMRNGDVISGKIKSVTNGKATIKPDYAGALEVKLSQVQSIRSDAPMEVELTDGRELSARFDGLADGRLVLASEGQTTPIEPGAIRHAVPPRKQYQRVTRVEASLSFDQGNTDGRKAEVQTDTRLRLGEHRHHVKAALRREAQNGVDRKRQNQFRYQYDWMVSKPWYVGFSADFESDPIRALDHRTTAGAVLGRDIVNTPGRFLTVKLGLGYSDERLGGIPENGPVGLGELTFEYDFGRLDVLHDLGVNYQHYGANNLVLKSTTALRFDLFRNLYTSLSYRFDYETEPAPGKSEYDSTLTVGLGAKF
jgi:putative salt-induced outer membrane protein YdiY